MLSYLTLIVLSLAASASARPMEQGNFYGSFHYPWDQQQQQQQHPSSFASEMYSIQHQPYDHNAVIPPQPYVQYSDPTQGGGPVPMGGPFPLQPLYQYPTPIPFQPVQPYPPPNLHHSSQQYPAPIPLQPRHQYPVSIPLQPLQPYPARVPLHTIQQYPSPVPHQALYTGIPAIPPINSNVAMRHPSSSISTYYATGYPPAESQDYGNYGHQRDLSAQFAGMSLAQLSHPQINPQRYHGQHMDRQVMVHQPQNQDQHWGTDSEQSSLQHQHHQHHTSSYEGGERNVERSKNQKRKADGEANLLKLFHDTWYTEVPNPAILGPQELAEEVLRIIAIIGLKRSVQVVVHDIEPLLTPETGPIFHRRFKDLWSKYNKQKTKREEKTNKETEDDQQLRIKDAQAAVRCLRMIDILAPLPPSLAYQAPDPKREISLFKFLEYLDNGRREVALVSVKNMGIKLRQFVQQVSIPGFKTKRELMERLIEYVQATRPEFPNAFFEGLIKFSEELDTGRKPPLEYEESSSSAH